MAGGRVVALDRPMQLVCRCGVGILARVPARAAVHSDDRLGPRRGARRPAAPLRRVSVLRVVVQAVQHRLDLVVVDALRNDK